jgi:DNA-binding transcriptional LysR family regulator
VANHGFVGLLPEIMMLDEIDAGTVVRVDMPGTPIVRDAGLIVRRDGYQRPVVDLLADKIRAACGAMFS